MAAGFFSSAGFSPASSPLSAFFRQPPRFSSGVKFEHVSLMQKGFFAPFPGFLNMVWPHTGQSFSVGTSQLMKSQRLLSSLLFMCSQQ